MNTLRRNLKIAFSLVSPEDVIADLKERGDLCYEKQAMRVNLHEMSEEYYIMASRKLLDNYSIDEIRNLYQEMNSLLESFGDIPKSLFQLLVSGSGYFYDLFSGVQDLFGSDIRPE